MSFATKWLQSWALFPGLIPEAPSENTGIIIVVPSYAETGINRLLDSLNGCEKPDCSAEVIIIINAPAGAGEDSLTINMTTLQETESWKNRTDPFFRLYPLLIENHSFRDWGVGMARKTGMDEALRRFDRLNRPEGVILSIDADCTVSKGYFKDVEKELLNRKERMGCTLRFEHPLSGDEYPSEVYNSVLQYEIHLRYLYQALRFSGFPYATHTVGSTIGVKALPYMKAGGMNRKQAGEDFYFLQKMVPAGGWFMLNSSSVCPSPRASFRVPFGTGNAISRMISSGKYVYMTYNPAAFNDLKTLFRLIYDLSASESPDFSKAYDGLPGTVRSFIYGSEWIDKLSEIAGNSADARTFRKRFFEWFNMFRVIKYLNHSHRGTYQQVPAAEAASMLLRNSGHSFHTDDPYELLDYLRKQELES